MHTSLRRGRLAAAAILIAGTPAFAQSAGNSGTINGTVTDASGAVVPNAEVSVENPVSHYSRKTLSDPAGHYHFNNLPFNNYHLAIAAPGFSAFSQDLDVRSTVPLALTQPLAVSGSSTTVNVEADSGDLLENDSTFHTDMDRGAFEKLPLESQSSSLSSLVTLASPGVSADSNGLFHGLGDHASNSFSIDGQSITDQQSKVFSNQIPTNAVQSLEVISGAPPAEYGGKTSLVIDVTTRSGQGVTTPTGAITASYGTFGSANGSVDLSYGGQKTGATSSKSTASIPAASSTRPSSPSSTTRATSSTSSTASTVSSRPKTPSTSTSASAAPGSRPPTPSTTSTSRTSSAAEPALTPIFGSVGNTDQRSKIVTFDVAPTYTHTLGSTSVFNLGAFVRRDGYNYYPSADPLADSSAPNLQNQSISQDRSLLNAGVHTDLSYVKGINNVKIGAQYTQTFLNENDVLGVASNTFNSPCVDANGVSQPGFAATNHCVSTPASSPTPTTSRRNL